MKVRFLTIAQREVNDAVEWYDGQSVGLGTDFLDDLDMAVRRIIRFPASCTEIQEGLRRCILSRFPYGLIYGLDGESVVVVAVAHLHREPRYWADRV